METYKQVTKYPQYFVSDKGNVKSLRYDTPLKGYKNSSGYIRVQLGNSKTKKLVHRLVAEHFCKNIDNKKFVNHKNGIKTDNRSENLEWVTRSENMVHAESKGLVSHIIGDDHHNSKLTSKKVREIKKLLLTLNCTQISKRYYVDRKTISDIKNGKTWKEVAL